MTFRVVNFVLAVLIVIAFLKAVGVSQSVAHAGYRPVSFSDCAPSRDSVISCIADNGALYLVAPKHPNDRGKLRGIQFGHIAYNGKRASFAGVQIVFKVAP